MAAEVASKQGPNSLARIGIVKVVTIVVITVSNDVFVIMVGEVSVRVGARHVDRMLLVVTDVVNMVYIVMVLLKGLFVAIEIAVVIAILTIVFMVIIKVILASRRTRLVGKSLRGRHLRRSVPLRRLSQLRRHVRCRRIRLSGERDSSWVH